MADAKAELAAANVKLAAANEQAAALARKGTALARLQRLPAEVQSLKVCALLRRVAVLTVLLLWVQAQRQVGMRARVRRRSLRPHGLLVDASDAILERPSRRSQ